MGSRKKKIREKKKEEKESKTGENMEEKLTVYRSLRKGITGYSLAELLNSEVIRKAKKKSDKK